MLSSFSSKVEIYILPVFPFLIAVAARQRQAWSPWEAAALTVPAVAFAASPLALMLVARRAELSFVGRPLFYAAAAVMAVAGLWTLVAAWRRRSADAAATALAAGMFAAVFVGGWAVPSINGHIGYAELCRHAARVGADCGASRFYACGLARADNLDVYLHRPVPAVAPAALDTLDLGGALLMLPADRIGCLPSEPMPACVSAVGHYTVVCYGSRLSHNESVKESEK